MSYQIEIIPAFELIGAALNYAHRGDEPDDRIATSSSISEWRGQVEAHISPFLSADIEKLFMFHLPVSFLHGAVLRFNLNTPEELCEWMTPKNVAKAQQLILELSDLQGVDPAEVNEAAVRRGLESYSSLFHTSISEEVEVVLYALRYTEAFLGRVQAALSEFYGAFVKDDLPRALAFLEDKRREHQKLLDERGEKFLNQITLDNYGSLYSRDDEIRIVLSYYANRFISLNTRYYKLMIYGFDVEQLMSRFNTAEVVDQFLKALADPKRAAIMRLLKHRQWYGKELADHFSLTTATMSYHIEKLISSRLVQFQTAEKNRILYSINREGVEEMLQLLREDFL